MTMTMPKRRIAGASLLPRCGHGLYVTTSALIFLLAVLPARRSGVSALAFDNNNNNNPLGLEGPGYNFVPSPPLSPAAVQRLQDLGIDPDRCQPVLAQAPPSQIASLVSATVPALLRGASGVFGVDYQLRWVPRDDAQYAYLATATNQLQETCHYAKPPVQPLILYQVESDAGSRQVREACSMLSLTVTMRPCPRGGRQFRQDLQQQYQVDSIPCLVDPNTSVTLSNTKLIIDYLFTTYGTGTVPWTLNRPDEDRNGGLASWLRWPTVSSALGVGLGRLGAGGSYQYSNPPPQQQQQQASATAAAPALTLWQYEGSPYCKLVAETLSALELEHQVIYTPRGSPNRALLWQQVGRFQVPYLQDANTGLSLFESNVICEYLQKQYGLAPSPVPFL